MRNKYVGFYWTLPIHWKGFTSLSPDAEEAATQSRTIRYQRNVIHEWARGEGFGDIVAEVTFMEKQDDRASDAVTTKLREAINHCFVKKAALVYVDFEKGKPQSHNRRHRHIKEYLDAQKFEHPEFEFIDLKPELIFLYESDPKKWDPFDHFEEWRKETKKRVPEIRRAAIEGLRRMMAEVPVGEEYYKRVADGLNEAGIRTQYSELWTQENVRKAIYRLRIIDRLEAIVAQIPEGEFQHERIAHILNMEGVKHYSDKNPWTAERVAIAIKKKLSGSEPRD